MCIPFDHDHARRRLCDSCEALVQSSQELRALQVRQHNYVRVLCLRLTPYLHLQTAHLSLPPIRCLIRRIHLHTQPAEVRCIEMDLLCVATQRSLARLWQ